MNRINQKEIQTKLARGLLDVIILEFLDQEPMHGYQIIAKIRKRFDIRFGPSNIYPLLGALQKKGYVKSIWNMDADRPKKVYELTKEGKNFLQFSEDSLNLICKKIASENEIHTQISPPKYNVINSSKNNRH
jgi:PadR family transcriptional regulator PadR